MSASPNDTGHKDDLDLNTAAPIDSSVPFVLGEWRIDPSARNATRGDEVVKIDPRNMRVLQILVERHGQIVSQRELEALAWEGVVVTPDSLYQSIRQLRQALNDTKSPAKYIETVPRRGYRMIAVAVSQSDAASANVLPDATAADSTARLTRHWLQTRHMVIASIASALVIALAGYLYAAVGSPPSFNDFSGERAEVLLQRPDLRRDVKTLRALASAEISSGNPESAVELLERALHAQIAEVGERSVTAVDVLAELAGAYLALDDDVSAMNTADRALTVLNQSDGISSLSRVGPNTALAEIFIAAGGYERAEELLNEAMEICRKHVSRGDLQTYQVLSSLSVLRLAQGRSSDAESVARDALTSAVEVRGALSIKAAYAHTVLAWALLEQRKISEAEAQARAALGIAERASIDHPYAWSARHILAEVLLQQHRPASAEKLLREELAALQSKQAISWRVARAASSLGAALLAQGEIDDAEKHLTLARQELISTKGWPMERENRVLNARLAELSALRDQKASLAKLDR